MIRELSFATAGAIIAVGLVISCSDDSPGNVDAAVCDCPVLMKYEDVRQSAQPALQARAVCPANWTLVGGGVLRQRWWRRHHTAVQRG